MIGKCVHYVSGIETKQMVKVDSHNGFDFYKLRKDAETEWTMIYFQHDGHFFSVSSNIERIKNVLDDNPSFNVLEWARSDFEQSLVTGARVSKGYAQYFKREQEAAEAVSRYKAQKEQEKADREAKEAEEEKQRQKEIENKISASEQQFKEGKKIDGDMFLSLCTKHEITVPIRTKGWIKESMGDISCSDAGRVQYSYSGNKSNSIGDIARNLYDHLTNKNADSDGMTLNELNHLFGA